MARDNGVNQFTPALPFQRREMWRLWLWSPAAIAPPRRLSAPGAHRKPVPLACGDGAAGSAAFMTALLAAAPNRTGRLRLRLPGGLFQLQNQLCVAETEPL
jgi:hypothetical protein